MVRTLLADRFGLSAHVEEREMDVLALVRATPKTPLPSGFERVPCLPSDRPPCRAGGGNGEIVSTGAPMTFLAERLGVLLGRRVVDRTGLEGRYKFTIKYGVADSQGLLSDGPEITTAIGEQLGLRLLSTRVRLPVLVIDRVHSPSPN
jgi:uncharacterized protein (TIGR03435 family)